MITDAELVALRPSMVGFAWQLCRHHAQAEDLTHAAIERALRNREACDGRNVFAWLCTIVRNLWLDACRHERLVREHAERATARSYPPPQETAVLAGQLADRIARLPLAQSRVIGLAMEGESMRSIASRVGAPTNTVKSRLRLARSALETL